MTPEPHPGGEMVMSWLPEPAKTFHPWLLLLIPTIGGLLSGWLIFTFAPEAEGHGTDSVIAAYHYRQGQIRPRVPLIKIVASALTIGSGGSGGREGPIAQIGAGFGSLLGNLLRLRPAERRVLMAAGMGAGIGAIFRAPLAGTIFAGEVLYSSTEFESEVILPPGWRASFPTASTVSSPAGRRCSPSRSSRSTTRCGWARTCSWQCLWSYWLRSIRTASTAVSTGSTA